MDYKQAGVDIDAGEEVVRRIKPLVKPTYTKGVVGDLGAFGGFFELDLFEYKRPVLVSSVDGVGTKLKIAVELGKYDTVGQCLVNHCVNDILVCGAKPLYFLDYYACGKLNPDDAVAVIGGMAKACVENECALIGGETAEMPGVYAERDFDLAGAIVGVVERDHIVSGASIVAGDALIGLASTGLHTNGYSLARKVFQGRLNEYSETLGATIGEALLAVHRSYLRAIYPMLRRFEIKGLAHITGGGLVGNAMRVIPKGLSLNIDWDSWSWPPIFEMIQKEGDVPLADMRRAFNLGIGLVIIASQPECDRIAAHLTTIGEKFWRIGEVVSA
ncbi:MAG: phosphoribosylformylglycinamidine cyclo-ligase [Chloroherpetonaceae bacterium]|nr:phosphoribosylformylglycinamidine cyclo-ligase [Chloroherpetonaceae bacterium]MDW8437823.1 phosphoribosylformylglycinamidine cyclo-ligase [Chloroherpetonaceae bacterium]